MSGTLAEPYEQQAYKYLREGSQGDFLQWGHEFQLQLAGDVSKEYGKRLDSGEPTVDLEALAEKLVRHFIKHNSEIEAVDLLLEIDQLEMALEYVDKDNIRRIYDYLLASTPFAADQDEYVNTLRMAFKFCMRVDEYFLALRAAMKLDDQALVEQAFNACQDPLLKKQLAFALGRQRLVVQTGDAELTETMSNSKLSDFYLKLVKDLDVEKPRHPDDIYKLHLEKTGGKTSLESLQHNIAMTYTNAFVNVASTKDSLMSLKDPWVNNVRKEGLMAAVASLGMINLWNIDESTAALSEFLDMKDGFAKAGALIGFGIANSGVWSDADPARAILEDNIGSSDQTTKLGAAIGLGLAYAGTARDEFRDMLCPIVTDLGIGPDTAGFAALSLGLIFVSKCDDEVVNTILTALMERPAAELDQASARLFAVGLALTYLGQQEKSEAAIETLHSIEHPLARYAEVCVEAAAYVGSGNVLKIQEFLKRCTAHEDESKSAPQSMAVLGIAFIAISEKIGNEMAARFLNHILQFCELPVKRAVPIALGLLNISNPSIIATDLLLKLAHDEDKEMSMRAILSLGLIGLGTNNSRISGLLRNLANYYYNDPGHVYLIRISQGLLSTGKGLLTANPFYSDLFLYSKTAMAGLFVVANCMLDMQTVFVDKFHYVIYYLVCSLYPRWLFTLDENLQNFPVALRVGQAVDTVAQVGNPRSITGFQTHTAPIVMQYGDRAELGTEEYIPVNKHVILENFVIVKKNPDFEKEKEAPRKKTSASIYF